MPLLYYDDGVEIREGDHITYDHSPGRVRWVIEGGSGDEERDWMFDEHGPGVMIDVARIGAVYFGAPHEEEDLLLVRRGDASEQD